MKSIFVSIELHFHHHVAASALSPLSVAITDYSRGLAVCEGKWFMVPQAGAACLASEVIPVTDNNIGCPTVRTGKLGLTMDSPQR